MSLGPHSPEGGGGEEAYNRSTSPPHPHSYIPMKEVIQ
jgi:hypothetical protein